MKAAVRQARRPEVSGVRTHGFLILAIAFLGHGDPRSYRAGGSDVADRTGSDAGIAPDRKAVDSAA
jgi:hypothetical protein